MKVSYKQKAMYRFIKIQDKEITSLIYDYMLFCDDLPMLLEHTEKYTLNHIKEGLQDCFQNKSHHANTIWRGNIETLAKIKETTVIEASVYLENKIYQGKLKAIASHGNILLRENGSYMLYSEGRYNILDDVTLENMIYPEGDYSIRIIKWNGGSHFYAKVGKFDVVDGFGNQKWNTRLMAEYHAEKFKENMLKDN